MVRLSPWPSCFQHLPRDNFWQHRIRNNFGLPTVHINANVLNHDNQGFLACSLESQRVCTRTCPQSSHKLGTCLPKHKVVRAEQLAEWTGANTVHSACNPCANTLLEGHDTIRKRDNHNSNGSIYIHIVPLLAFENSLSLPVPGSRSISTARGT